MKRSSSLWILAVVITLASAFYQRRTGPTHPIRSSATLGRKALPFTLERSHGGESGSPVRIRTDDPAITGWVEWKRHGVSEAWQRIPMVYSDGVLAAELPHQPPAGRLDYKVALQSRGESVILPEGAPAVIRFKGDVPNYLLIPHIIAMFAAMLLSNRAGLEVLEPSRHLRTLAYLTLGFLTLGGMILGPLVQKHAFGAYWTGWPFGTDLTDNKTLVALLAWISASVAMRRTRRPEIWTAAAALILLAVYMIPHSLLGSSIDYGKAVQHQRANWRP